ncbi:Serine/threonine protein kinase [Enhygromyxa salina]|uniref:Serine/threonine protein kinase n=1 Tax=Enhygromyxa salina TaxID=215803 RepID=A0A0C2CQE6_9BACT|nr:serine/threonine-protein kinase [Enhygromyxa salina]KIG11940.1 Serine/threonine protein kinase [Enhygromyxa salina]
MARVPEKIGHYQIQGLLGKGAMGEVYEGRDPNLGRRVALKVLGRKHQESSEFKERFLREGRSLASMNHANVVQVYFIGEFEGRPYLAMEFLDGEDIGGAIKKNGPLHPGDAAEVVRQASVGLLEAKRAGVVHRDVKPSNLVVTKAGEVKVTDFGLAKALQEDLSITATGVFVGTPDYLAPEQAMGEDVDSSADVYALGCSLYHMCTGSPPFRKGGSDDHYTAVVRRHLKAERPVLKAQIAGFDEPLSDLCRRMMSRRPDVRPTLEELIDELPVIIGRIGGQIPPRHAAVEVITEAPPAAVEPAGSKAEDVRAAEAAPSASQKTWVLAIVIGIVIGVVVSLGVMLMVN